MITTDLYHSPTVTLKKKTVLLIVYYIVRPYKPSDRVRWYNSFVCHISRDSKRLQHSCRQQSFQDQAWHELTRCDIRGLFSSQSFKDKQILVIFTSLSQTWLIELIIQGAVVSTVSLTGNEAYCCDGCHPCWFWCKKMQFITTTPCYHWSVVQCAV